MDKSVYIVYYTLNDGTMTRVMSYVCHGMNPLEKLREEYGKWGRKYTVLSQVKILNGSKDKGLDKYNRSKDLLFDYLRKHCKIWDWASEHLRAYIMVNDCAQGFPYEREREGFMTALGVIRK